MVAEASAPPREAARNPPALRAPALEKGDVLARVGRRPFSGGGAGAEASAPPGEFRGWTRGHNDSSIRCRAYGAILWQIGIIVMYAHTTRDQG